jgi:hypothetical protein
MLRRSVFGDGILQERQDISGVDAVALPRILVDEIEAAQLAATLSVVGDEVPGPFLIRYDY